MSEGPVASHIPAEILHPRHPQHEKDVTLSTDTDPPPEDCTHFRIVDPAHRQSEAERPVSQPDQTSSTAVGSASPAQDRTTSLAPNPNPSPSPSSPNSEFVSGVVNVEVPNTDRKEASPKSIPVEAEPQDQEQEEEQKPPSRCSRCRYSVGHFFTLPVPMWTLFTATLLALFIEDIIILSSPPKYDDVAHIVLLICFFLFTVEMIALSACKDGYIFSFFWILDLMSFVSLGMLALDYLGAGGFSADFSSGFAMARTGKSAKLGRSAGKLARLFRAIRLLRVVRVFKFFGAGSNAQDEDAELDASQLGTLAAELTSRRVVLLTMLLVVTLPFLDNQEEYDTALELGMQLLGEIYVTGQNQFGTALNMFLNTHTATKFLSINNDVIVNQDMSYLRTTELRVVSLDGVTIRLDISSIIRQRAIFEVGFVLFIIAVLVLASYILLRDSKRLVVGPIMRMLQVVNQVTSLVQDEEDRDGRNQQAGAGGTAGTASSSSSSAAAAAATATGDSSSSSSSVAVTRATTGAGAAGSLPRMNSGNGGTSSSAGDAATGGGSGTATGGAAGQQHNSSTETDVVERALTKMTRLVRSMTAAQQNKLSTTTSASAASASSSTTKSPRPTSSTDGKNQEAEQQRSSLREMHRRRSTGSAVAADTSSDHQ